MSSKKGTGYVFLGSYPGTPAPEGWTPTISLEKALAGETQSITSSPFAENITIWPKRTRFPLLGFAISFAAFMVTLILIIFWRNE